MVSCPDVFVHLVQLDPGGADAGVGHDDVQSAELLDTAVDRRLQRVVVPDVDLAVTMRRSRFSTMSAVSARSSGVATGSRRVLEAACRCRWR